MLRFLSRSDKTSLAEGEAETKKDSANNEHVQELLRNYEGKTPRMGSAAVDISPRLDGILEGIRARISRTFR